MRVNKFQKNSKTAIVNFANDAYTVQLWTGREVIAQEVYRSQEAAEQRGREWCDGLEDGIPEPESETEESVVDSGEVTVYANTAFGQTKY